MTMYFEDIPVDEVHVFGPREITEDDIIAFARKYDPQPFHIDPEKARESIFGGLIASGWHTVGIMMRLLVDGTVNDTAGLGSPGIDDLRWIKPVRPGDRLRVRSRCIEKTPSRSRPEIGSCRYFTEVLNQDDEVVMSLYQIGLVKRRPGGPASSLD